VDARLQKIQITPVKLDDEGNVKTLEAAVIALEIPIDSVSQKKAVIEVLGMLSEEWLKVTIATKQLRLDFEQQAELPA